MNLKDAVNTCFNDPKYCEENSVSLILGGDELIEIPARLLFSKDWRIRTPIDDPKFAENCREILRHMGGNPDAPPKKKDTQ